MTTDFQFGKMKKILKIDDGDGCVHSLNVLNATELYT